MGVWICCNQRHECHGELEYGSCQMMPATLLVGQLVYNYLGMRTSISISIRCTDLPLVYATVIPSLAVPANRNLNKAMHSQMFLKYNPKVLLKRSLNRPQTQLACNQMVAPDLMTLPVVSRTSLLVHSPCRCAAECARK